MHSTKSRDNICFLNTVSSATGHTVVHCGLQVWEEVDQSGEDQREADGGPAHRDTLGVSYVYGFRQRQTNVL